MSLHSVPVGVLAFVSILGVGSRAQEAPSGDAPKTAKPAPTPKKPAASRRPAGRTYMGRPIADVMGFEGADWLVRKEREEEERPDDMIDALKIKPGSVVADVGAGVGYTSLRLAERVGAEGSVLATDLQPRMLQKLAENAKAANVANIKPIRCTPDDPRLPDAGVDLILMVDVYHECSNPEATLKGLRKALKPDGRLVLVEFRGEDPSVPIKPEHKMTVAQVRKELEPQGFTLKERHEFLPWQHILIFVKSAEEPPAKKAAK